MCPYSQYQHVHLKIEHLCVDLSGIYWGLGHLWAPRAQPWTDERHAEGECTKMHKDTTTFLSRYES
jgi:hypothetical protein